MSGLRHGEICGMQKAKFNRDRREIDVYRFKTDRWKMYSPLTDTMIALIDEGILLYADGDHIFSEVGKLQHGFYTQMKKACVLLGITYGKFKEGGLILHDARHTFTTILHHNQIDNRTTTEFTDNPSAVGNYQHSTNDSKSRAMEIIENKFNPVPKESAEKELIKVFEAVAGGKMDFEKFKKALSNNCGFTAIKCQNKSILPK